MIYRIIDVSDPTNPVEAGRWWLPEQWAAGQMEKIDKQVGGLSGLDMAGMHGPAYVKSDYAYVSYGGAGMVILDISNIAVPRLVGQLKHMPPLSGGLGLAQK